MIDDELSISDIQTDIRQCQRMIRRSEYKITLYQRKLEGERLQSHKQRSLLEKGLSLLNLNRHSGREV